MAEARERIYQQICEDIATQIKAGQQIIVVHGASHETNQLSIALNQPPQFLTSVSGHESRRTDRKTLEIFIMAVAGKINTRIVETLQQQGINALGLTGCDGQLLMGERKKAIKAMIDGKRRMIRDDYTGKVDTVNTSLLTMLLEAGYTPVIAPIALSTECEAINVDGDRAAAKVAGALQAQELIIFTQCSRIIAGHLAAGFIDHAYCQNEHRVIHGHRAGTHEEETAGSNGGHPGWGNLCTLNKR